VLDQRQAGGLARSQCLSLCGDVGVDHGGFT
jgi:hypothetical protein